MARKPFRLPESTAILQLDGPWEGAEIEVNLSVGWTVYDAVRRWMERFAEVRDDGSDPAAVGEALREVADLFVRHALRGWNLEDRDGPIPQTTEGLLAINDPHLMAAIVGGWLGAVGTVPDPLPAGSPAGRGPRSTRPEAATTPTPASPSPAPMS